MPKIVSTWTRPWRNITADKVHVHVVLTNNVTIELKNAHMWYVSGSTRTKTWRRRRLQRRCFFMTQGEFKMAGIVGKVDLVRFNERESSGESLETMSGAAL